MPPPKVGVAYEFPLGLIESANRPNFLASPVLEAGDFKISKDGAAFAPLTATPTVSPAGSEAVIISLTAAEMTVTKYVVIVAKDDDAIWDPVFIHIEPVTQTVQDIPTAAQNADKLLGRNLAGGLDGGRTVQQALRALRNLRQIIAGIFTVFREDDVTPDWTATVTTTPGDPIDRIDPS